MGALQSAASVSQIPVIHRNITIQNSNMTSASSVQPNARSSLDGSSR